MPDVEKARVFMSGRSQHVTIPHPFRFRSREVSIRRDPGSGDVILSEGPGPWSEVFAALDEARVPADFLAKAERDRRPPTPRPVLEAFFAGKVTSRGKRP